MAFPKETQADLEAFYSRHKLRADGKPTAAWESARDVLVRTLGGVKGGGRLSWQLFYDPGMKTYVLNIHQV